MARSRPYLVGIAVHIYLLIHRVYSGCQDLALGMQSNVISDNKITASSGTAGDQARLNYTNGPSWCVMGSDTNPYLQIDLGTPHIICAVSTQGDYQADKRVKTFQIRFSSDGKTFNLYRENGNTERLFYGNLDSSGIVKQIFYKRIMARYLRILPKMYHGAICMRAEIYGAIIQSENLALNKPTKQSSTLGNGNASRAVDGNRDGAWLRGSCTHCKKTWSFEWWRVDLGTSVRVTEVSVFTRSHPKYGLRLWDTLFSLYIDQSTSSSLSSRCGGKYGIIPAGSITIVCNPARYGRYVTIRQLAQNQQLSLCEVEVYGEENYAYHKFASQSSLGHGHGEAKHAVDGNRDSDFTSKSCTHTVEEYQPWWMVDLGHSIPVYEVYIVNRASLSYRLRDFQIQIGENGMNGGTSNPFCGDVCTIPVGDSRSIYCQPNLIGRYLTVTLRNISEILTLCEVEVYRKDNACVRQAVGISNSSLIPDSQLTSSSNYSITRSSADARLLGSRSWRPSDDDTNPWLQIDLGEVYYVCAVATQGDPFKDDERTRKYKIKWSKDGFSWAFVINKTSSNVTVFTGNRDDSSIIKHIFDVPLLAKLIRFIPVKQNTANSLRIEIYGIKEKIAPVKPSKLEVQILQPVIGSYVDLVCKGDHGLNIKWYFNNTEIQSDSYITSKSNGTIISKLSIKYTSADDVYDKYTCGDVIALKRNCTSLEYICQVDYGSYRKEQSKEIIITELEVPKAPVILKISTSVRSALLVWTQPKLSHSEGNITHYNIKLIGQARRIVTKDARTEYKLKFLEPSTKYRVKVKAVSRIGESTWSTEKGFVTQGSSMVTAVAVVIPLLIIIFIVLILYFIWWKRRTDSRMKNRVVIELTDDMEINDDGTLRDSIDDMESCKLSLSEESDQNEDDHQHLASLDIYSETFNQEKKGSIPTNQYPEYVKLAEDNDYGSLRYEFQQLKQSQQFLSTVAKRPANKTKNRYGNIVPYDSSRVILEGLNGVEDSDYINASYIRGFDNKNVAYIATQGPIKQTVDDFWRMIWQENTSVIVMLTGLVEDRKKKCQKYWPETSATYLKVSVKLQNIEAFADYSIRTFLMTETDTSEERYVFQYHFTAWPDKGVPQYATQLLGFRKRLLLDTVTGSSCVNHRRKRLVPDFMLKTPWVVHCSAGVGRTGAFLAIDAMLRQADEKKSIDIFNYIKTMRESRSNMVQTEEQYIFVYMAVLESLTCGVTEIPVQNLRRQLYKLDIINRKEGISGFKMEFKHLSSVCHVPHENETTAGNQVFNNKKNRFPHILPLDKARVILQLDSNEEGADYVNASYANGYRHKDAYIMTQAPLDNTIADFWKMIYNKNLGTIVMLNNLQEGNEFYPMYWPVKGMQQYGNMTVKIIQEANDNSVVTRRFRITKTDGSKKVNEVRHFQFSDWSDGSVPKNTKSVLELIEKLQRSQQQSGNKSIVVQCSDGVGRSGTFCTILSLLERVKTEQMVDVFQTVKALRISRPGAVENVVQYKFCFQLVIAYLDSFNEYSNFKS